MRKNEPKGVNEILSKILFLDEEIRQKREEIETLKNRLQEKDERPQPKGFDYKKAVLSVFSKSPNDDLNVDDVVQKISVEYEFTPNRTKIANRMNYLTDREKKLERIQEKRGYYRLKKIDLLFQKSEEVHKNKAPSSACRLNQRFNNKVEH